MKFQFNIPNRITLLRVALIPLFAAILLADIPHKPLLSAFIFIMLSISDAFDGYFARKKNQITKIGQLIDPIADKLLISTALIFLIGNGVELWMAIAIISREVIITGIRFYLIPSKIAVPSSFFGKAKTVMQSIAIIFTLLQFPMARYMMILAVMLTLYSGAEYLIKIRIKTGNKIVNLPNLITLSRLLLIIPFAYYFLNSKINLALIIFGIITLSDKLDGVSARVMHQMTEFGSLFDSASDTIFILTTLMLLIHAKYVTVFYAAMFILPIILIVWLKAYNLKKNRRIIKPTISTINVGLGYAAILALLIDFAYKNIFLMIVLASTYATLAVFAFKTFSKK
ncbi:MAG TPA: CDP-diacylglycerol--glycerol-3-phosphate 3-phosphatidyltransferase [Candidatus Nanoarchaeia archaeon]|nr:CDP-diacylglycerol--glycerol-3-phosphate 3-phosphatidyltransferase [Candidatus Nanoarchaeia archaeon]